MARQHWSINYKNYRSQIAFTVFDEFVIINELLLQALNLSNRTSVTGLVI